MSDPAPTPEGNSPDRSENASQPPVEARAQLGQITIGDPLSGNTRAMALVALMTDGDLSPEDRDELRLLIKANPGVLESYVEQAVSHAMLEWRYAQVPDDSVTASDSADADSGSARTFVVHGEISLRPASDGSGSLPALPGRVQTDILDSSRRRRRYRRWPMVAVGFAAGMALVAAAFLWLAKPENPAAWNPQPQPGSQGATALPLQPAVYIGFESLNAIGGTLRKQLDPRSVTWVPQGLTFPKLACHGGALKIDSTYDQFLWLDLDADLVISPDRGAVGALQGGHARGQDVAWPHTQVMGKPGTTMYLSFLIRAERPVAYGYCGVMFSYGDHENLFVGKARGVPGFSYDFEKCNKTLLDSDPSTLAVEPIPLDTKTHLIVTRVDFREAEDRFAIYFDPDPISPEPQQANATGVGKIAMDRIRIAAGRGADTQGGAVWYLDEIRLADRYQAVVPLAGESPPADNLKRR